MSISIVPQKMAGNTFMYDFLGFSNGVGRVKFLRDEIRIVTDAVLELLAPNGPSLGAKVYAFETGWLRALTPTLLAAADAGIEVQFVAIDPEDHTHYFYDVLSYQNALRQGMEPFGIQFSYEYKLGEWDTMLVWLNRDTGVVQFQVILHKPGLHLKAFGSSEGLLIEDIQGRCALAALEALESGKTHIDL